MNEPENRIYGFEVWVVTRVSCPKLLSDDERSAQSRQTGAAARAGSTGATTAFVVVSSSAIPQLRSVAGGDGE